MYFLLIRPKEQKHFWRNLNEGLSLASYKMDIGEMASKAIELMIQRIDYPDTPYSSAMIRGSLVIGESVKSL